jgi:hypothetical protein
VLSATSSIDIRGHGNLLAARLLWGSLNRYSWTVLLDWGLLHDAHGRQHFILLSGRACVDDVTDLGFVLVVGKTACDATRTSRAGADRGRPTILVGDRAAT